MNYNNQNYSNTSPSNSSISISAITGGEISNPAFSIHDIQYPNDPFSFQDRKDEALSVLKSDLMAALNKEVRSLDEDNWKFEGPRSRINHVSRSGGFIRKQTDISQTANSSQPKKLRD